MKMATARVAVFNGGNGGRQRISQDGYLRQIITA